MDENFLQYVWKYQQFDSTDLATISGENIRLFHPGHHNKDSGPDFEEARLKIGSVEWAGHVEVHLKSSDWVRHNHSTNKAYENVILHVVWDHDQEIEINNYILPTLELKHRVDEGLLEKYSSFIQREEPIICKSQLASDIQPTYRSMLDKVLAERLEQKADFILDKLKKSNNDWDSAFYQVLLINFGFSLNKKAFESLSGIIPFSLFKKYSADHKKIEALLFGQSGFLSVIVDDYQAQLLEEFKFLQSKHQLKPALEKHQWKFGKARPANFPTVRIAQIANLMSTHPRLFTKIIDSSDVKDIKKLFQYESSAYWKQHYDFGKKKKSTSHTYALGSSSIDILLINTIAPLFAAYSSYSGDQLFMEKAIELLENTKAEKNRITLHWDEISSVASNAFESQAQLQLYKNYCEPKKCLSCAIGIKLLKK